METDWPITESIFLLNQDLTKWKSSTHDRLICIKLHAMNKELSECEAFNWHDLAFYFSDRRLCDAVAVIRI